jgi:hypothetical protein
MAESIKEVKTMMFTEYQSIEKSVVNRSLNFFNRRITFKKRTELAMQKE